MSVHPSVTDRVPVYKVPNKISQNSFLPLSSLSPTQRHRIGERMTPEVDGRDKVDDSLTFMIVDSKMVMHYTMSPVLVFDL